MSSNKRNPNLRKVKDLQPGTKVKLTDVVIIKHIDDMNVRIPTKSENVFLISTSCVTGPFRSQNGEFVVTGDTEVEIIPEHKAKLWERMMAWFF